MTTKPNAYETVTASIIKALEEGEVPAWRKEWVATALTPTSLSSGKAYQGTNRFLLMASAMASGYSSPLWGTYNQIKAQGGQVRKGEKATPVVLWKPMETTDSSGKVKKSAFMRAFAVFSADQADWEGEAPTYEKGELRTDTEVIAEAEALMTGYLGGTNAPSLAYGGDRAYYSPSRDGIQLPERGAFTTDIAFYATAYHEMAHSTGHKSRLAREGVVESHYFGSATYSEEELVAELTSAFLCAETGVLPSTIENSTAYIKGWLSVLKSDPKILIRASSRAEKATNLILGKIPTPTEEEE